MTESPAGARHAPPVSPPRARLTGWTLAALMIASVPAAAAPRVPAADATVLEHVPAAAAARQLEPLRARLVQRPGDLATTLALARGYLDIGRAQSDPRFVSYAEATLAPWLAATRADPVALTLAATAAQYLHRFDEALALLERALAREPRYGQAWLIRASILQVQGHFDEARSACRKLIDRSGQLIALICLTGVNSLNGQLAASYAALQSVYDDDPRLPVGVRVWALDELADMAERCGDSQAAEGYLSTALYAAPQDPFTKAAYADLLLARHRDAEVVQLLHADEPQDNLLLRLAIAGTRLQQADSRRWSALYRARYEAARRDGDFTHLREQARFVLDVEGNATEALRLAQRNWAVQREPADVRLYLAAATAAASPEALRSIRDWIRAMRYEDRGLESAAPGTAWVPRQ